MADGAMDSEAFGRLSATLRPRLHRYCARMVGSAIDGEDVVQTALAKAAQALAGAGPIEAPERWLFRIAHNAALDALRRRRPAVLLGEGLDAVADPAADAGARIEAAGSFAAFLALTPAQRACVVLIDVLGYSAAETAQVLETTVAAVKAALHRGRAGLRAQAAATAPPLVIDPTERARLRAYADRFNARDFDALRDLLAEDVRLDLVDRTRLAGRKDVSIYFTRYGETFGWRVRPGLAEGRPALLFAAEDDPTVRYVVLLGWRAGRIVAIRDFLYAPYAMEGIVTAEDPTDEITRDKAHPVV